MDVLKTISLITSLVEPMLVPSNTVPSSSIKYAFMTPPFLLCSCSFPIWDWKFISAQIFTILSCGERFFNWFFEIFQEFCYSSAITSSCFHIHENKKLGGSTICWFGWKSAYASKLATHFLIQTSAWLNCNMIFYPAILSFSIAFTVKRMILYGWYLFEKDTHYE